MKKTTARLLVIHGEDDEVFRMKHAEDLVNVNLGLFRHIIVRIKTQQYLKLKR